MHTQAAASRLPLLTTRAVNCVAKRLCSLRRGPKFSETPAFYGYRESRKGPGYISPSLIEGPRVIIAQTVSAIISFAAFIIYFTALRKESEWEQRLDPEVMRKLIIEKRKKALVQMLKDKRIKADEYQEKESEIEQTFQYKTKQ